MSEREEEEEKTEDKPDSVRDAKAALVETGILLGV
jgi:hypothetical protein